MSGRQGYFGNLCLSKLNLAQLPSSTIRVALLSLVRAGSHLPQWERCVLRLGKYREGREFFLPLSIPSCLQLRVIHMPKWHIWGWHILIPSETIPQGINRSRPSIGGLPAQHSLTALFPCQALASQEQNPWSSSCFQDFLPYCPASVPHVGGLPRVEDKQHQLTVCPAHCSSFHPSEVIKAKVVSA